MNTEAVINFTIRYREDIKPGMWVRFQGDKWNISTLGEYSFKRTYLGLKAWIDGRKNKALSILWKQGSKNLERNDAPLGFCSQKCRSNTRCSVVRRVYHRAAASVFNASGCRRDETCSGL